MSAIPRKLVHPVTIALFISLAPFMCVGFFSSEAHLIVINLDFSARVGGIQEALLHVDIPGRLIPDDRGKFSALFPVPK